MQNQGLTWQQKLTVVMLIVAVMVAFGVIWHFV